MEALTALAAIVIAFIIAFLPTIVANRRNHNNTMPIFICNLIGLFTGVFYLVALIWCFTDNKKGA